MLRRCSRRKLSYPGAHVGTTEGTHHKFVALDGLRGIAAIVVVLFHRRLYIEPEGHWHGYLAVDFFFILSGFVLSFAYGNRLKTRQLPFRQFMITRIIRLYPLIVVGALLGGASYLIEAIERHWFGLGVKGALATAFGMLALPQPFLALPFQPNEPVWSLFFEIIANIIFALIAPRLSNRVLAIVTSALGVGLVLTICTYGGLSFGWLWPTLPFGLLRVGFPFFAGVVLQRLHHAGHLNVPAAPIWIIAPALIAVLLSPELPWWQEILFSCAVVFLIFPVLVASAANDNPSQSWLKVASFSAALSFPLYIVHMPIQRMLELTPGFWDLNWIVRLAVMVPVCCAVALIAAHFYDKPVRAWLTKKSRRL